MAVRSKVRDAQRAIAALDVAHRHATARLERATARRAAVVAEHDRRVHEAELAVAATVAEMARQLSTGLTAQMLGCNEADVRRYIKTAADQRGAGQPGADQPADVQPDGVWGVGR